MMVFIMTKKEKTIIIDDQLWLKAQNELPMPINEFIENCFRWYLGTDTKNSRLLKKAVKLQTELDKVTNKIYKEQNRKSNIDNTQEYIKAMETVYRIHNELGYIGRNQLEKIGNQHNFNINDWIKFVSDTDEITIENYGALPKR